MKTHRIFIHEPAPGAEETPLHAFFWQVVLTTWRSICFAHFASPEARVRAALHLAGVLARAQAAQHRNVTQASPREYNGAGGISAETMHQIEALLHLL